MQTHPTALSLLQSCNKSRKRHVSGQVSRCRSKTRSKSAGKETSLAEGGAVFDSNTGFSLASHAPVRHAELQEELHQLKTQGQKRHSQYWWQHAQGHLFEESKPPSQTLTRAVAPFSCTQLAKPKNNALKTREQLEAINLKRIFRLLSALPLAPLQMMPLPNKTWIWQFVAKIFKAGKGKYSLRGKWRRKYNLCSLIASKDLWKEEMWFTNVVWALLMQPGLPHVGQENAEEKIWSQLTWALVAIPAPVSRPMSCETSLRYRSGYHWQMNCTALATQISFTSCQGKRNQRTKLVTTWKK